MSSIRNNSLILERPEQTQVKHLKYIILMALFSFEVLFNLVFLYKNIQRFRKLDVSRAIRFSSHLT